MSERLFYVYRQGLETELGLGITERQSSETTYIASIYLGGGRSRSEVVWYYVDHIMSRTNPGDKTVIVTNDMTMRSKRRFNYPDIEFVVVASNRSTLREAKMMANDSLKRKSTITEELKIGGIMNG
ncbi:hypothetical protein [Rossellomorea marisflavi]|uniref:hypothetical protein n=1 Tax=Rossellomorea marisflavi TaxID=189381 RepID=UPI00064EA587|nr:hypothetical protein [Rossellomorea marisflavi]KMK93718.1 hypothetical protein VL03_12675 [Rossellomorea marisflavi]